MKAKCDEIKVGERVRKDLGDIKGLAADIKEVGLLQPIGVTKDNELVFGERRLSACKSLNYKEIEVVVIDSDKILECEALENVSRKGFVMSERVAIRKALKEEESKKRRKMVAKGIRIPKSYPTLGSQKYLNILAKFSGVSHNTADKENSIVAYGDRKIIEQVDKDELSVSKAYDLIKEKKEKSKVPDKDIVNEIEPLPIEEPIEPPIEPAQIGINVHLQPGIHVYNVVSSDEYDNMMYPTSSVDKVRGYAKKIGTGASDCLIRTVVPVYENLEI